VNTASDNSNCGSCGNQCADEEVCDDGACSVQCLSPNTECTGLTGGGGGGGRGGGRGATQCVDLQTDLDNCGLCGVTCPDAAVCEGGACICPSNTTDCSGTCSDLQTDGNNCGACGTACAAGEECTAGACG
jgi:hypothetical protein